MESLIQILVISGIVLGCILASAILFVLFTIIISQFINPNKEYTTNSKFFRGLLNLWTTITMHLLGIKVIGRGTDRVPEGRYLLVASHKSNFDPIVTWYVLKSSNLAFISKPENFNIPFFGRIIRKCCFQPIDRENPRNAIKTMQKAAALAKDDKVSIGIYPEGTRNKGEAELLDFHNAVFKIAQMANIPIVVVTTSGTEQIAKNVPTKGSIVYVDVLDVITPEEIKGVKTNMIGDRVRDTMLAQIRSY